MFIISVIINNAHSYSFSCQITLLQSLTNVGRQIQYKYQLNIITKNPEIYGVVQLVNSAVMSGHTADLVTC